MESPNKEIVKKGDGARAGSKGKAKGKGKAKAVKKNVSLLLLFLTTQIFQEDLYCFPLNKVGSTIPSCIMWIDTGDN